MFCRVGVRELPIYSSIQTLKKMMLREIDVVQMAFYLGDTIKNKECHKTLNRSVFAMC